MPTLGAYPFWFGQKPDDEAKNDRDAKVKK